jgi:hypothetical protein
VGRLLAVVVLTLVLAPGALAATKVRFAVSLRATITSSWEDQTRSSNQGCEVTAVSNGNQRFEVRSTRPARITLVARRGRVTRLAGMLRRLVVNATGSESTALTTCGQFTTSECALGAPTIQDASVQFSRRERGVVQLTQLEAPGFDGWRRCVPGSLVEPGYPLLGRVFGSLNERSLLRRRTVVVSGDREAVTHVVAPGQEELGELHRRFSWTLTFRRVGR